MCDLSTYDRTYLLIISPRIYWLCGGNWVERDLRLIVDGNDDDDRFVIGCDFFTTPLSLSLP